MRHLNNYRLELNSSSLSPFKLPSSPAFSDDVRERVKELVTLCLELVVKEEERVREYISHYSLLLDIPRALAVVSNMTKLSVMAACWRELATASEGKERREEC